MGILNICFLGKIRILSLLLGASDEYPQYVFLEKKRKNINTFWSSVLSIINPSIPS